MFGGSRCFEKFQRGMSFFIKRYFEKVFPGSCFIPPFSSYLTLPLLVWILLLLLLLSSVFFLFGKKAKAVILHQWILKGCKLKCSLFGSMLKTKKWNEKEKEKEKNAFLTNISFFKGRGDNLFGFIIRHQTLFYFYSRSH